MENESQGTNLQICQCVFYLFIHCKQQTPVVQLLLKVDVNYEYSIPIPYVKKTFQLESFSRDEQNHNGFCLNFNQFFSEVN